MGNKISVIGAGNVGSTAAQRIAERNLADTVLVDILDGIPQGKALDILQSAPTEGFTVNISGTNDFAAIADSDIVMVTAGVPRKPGMTREDLLKINARITQSVALNIKKYAPNSIIIMVANPLDSMTQLAQKISGFPTHRVFGMAGILDSVRFRTFIALELNVPSADIAAVVLGGHGDAMVPLPQYTLVKGKPISESVSREVLEKLIQRTRDGGAEIVKYLKTGSAYYAPSSGAVEMAEAVLKDTKAVIPSSVYLTGQYGLNDVYIGVPARLGRSGIEAVVELNITPEQKAALHRSANIVKENVVEALKLLA